MIAGSCHCGAVRWSFKSVPDSATARSCTVCRRYGTLWAYDFEGEGIEVSGPTQVYTPATDIGFHYCPSCGGLAYWRALRQRDDGRRRIAVNLRLAEDPQAVGGIGVKHLDGLGDWKDVRDGRCVKDMWF
jgi:hypothetical protein